MPKSASAKEIKAAYRRLARQVLICCYDFSLFFYCFFLLVDWNVRFFNSCVKHLEKNRNYFVTIHLRSFLAGVDAIEVV